MDAGLGSDAGSGADLGIDARPADAGGPVDAAGFEDSGSPPDAECVSEGEPTPAPVLEPLVGALAARVAMNDGHGGGTIRIAEGETVLLKTASGMDTDDTFHIASTSKAFTAAAVLILVEDGLIDLDAPIGDLLPAEVVTGLLVIGGHDYGPEITVRQLLDHTSGLPDYWYDPPFVRQGENAFLAAYEDDPDHFFAPSELIDYARALDPIGVPGAGFHYADTGYVLAGLIIEQHTGMALADFYRERIYRPLGLSETYLVPREPPVSCHPEAHRFEGDWDMTGHTHLSADWAGGGLISSSRDLALFIRGLMRGDLFRDPASLDAMRITHPTGAVDVSYGLGLYRLQLDDGLGALFGHDGYGTAFMYYWPERDITFTGTLNQAENDWWPLVEAAIIALD